MGVALVMAERCRTEAQVVLRVASRGRRGGATANVIATAEIITATAVVAAVGMVMVVMVVLLVMVVMMVVVVVIAEVVPARMMATVVAAAKVRHVLVATMMTCKVRVGLL